MGGKIWHVLLVGAAVMALLSNGWVHDEAHAEPAGLTWHDCGNRNVPAGTECSSLTVPLDWAHPHDGRKVSIAVAMHRATGARKGLLTFNPGGPGTSGIDLLGPLIDGYVFRPGSGLPANILSSLDILAWDPRGVGLSTPSIEGCTGMVSFGELAQTGQVDWLAATQTYHDSLGSFLANCLQTNPEAEYLGTWSVIRDLDALRAAMGEKQLNYLGMSYGTTIGMAYAREFPDRVRTLVLDGVAPPSQSIEDVAAAHVWGWQYALDTFAAISGAQTAHRVAEVVRTLDESSIVTDDGIVVGRWSDPDVGLPLEGLVYGLSGQSKYPRYQQIFQQIYSGIGNSAPALTSAMTTIQGSQQLAVISFVMCSDRPRRPTVAEIAGLARSAELAGLTVAGKKVIEGGVVCPGLPDSFGTPLNDSTTAMELPHSAVLVNATADPRTQWLRARIGANQIRDSRLISYTSSQHIVYPATPSECVRKPVTEYILTGNLPATDTTCDYVPTVISASR